MDEQQLRELLEKLGFGEYKSRALIFLLSRGKSSSAKEISDSTGVPLVRIYSVLIGLESAGLLKRIPGKVQLYVADSNSVVKMLSQQEAERLVEEQKQSQGILKLLSSGLKGFQQKGSSPKVEVTYFESDEEYWPIIVAEEAKLKRGDVRRVLYTGRMMWSYMEEEFKVNPSLRRYVEQSKRLIEKGVGSHYIINPKTMVEATIADLKDPRQVLKSLVQGLVFYNKHKQRIIIRTTPDISNITVTVCPEAIFFEFYIGSYERISSAIEIKSAKVARDFGVWFDSMLPKVRPEQTFIIFKDEIKKLAETLAGINKEDFEKELRKAGVR